jgi:proline iminopeptidase
MALLTGALACRAPVGQPGAEQASVHQERVRVGPIALQTVSVGPTDGPVILVVHGGPGLDHNYMRPWFDGVRSPRARVVYVDLRGHGRSDMPPDSEGFTIGATAGDLAELLLRLSPTDPAVVIGHDFGAAISLTLAASHPERVRKLVLIAPLRDGLQIRSLGARTRATLGPAGAAAIGALSTAQGTLRDPRQLRALFAALGPMWWARPPSDALLDSLTRSVQYHGVTDGNFLAQLVLWDGRAVARNVRTPTLVVGGALDKTCLPIESRELADSLPHGQYAEIAQAGHLPFVEQPQRFVSLVRAFVTE